MGFSRQEYWSRLPCPLPGDLPNPGIELLSLTSPALAGGFFPTRTTWEVPIVCLASYYNIREGWVSVLFVTEVLGSPLKLCD